MLLTLLTTKEDLKGKFLKDGANIIAAQYTDEGYLGLFIDSYDSNYYLNDNDKIKRYESLHEAMLVYLDKLGAYSDRLYNDEKNYRKALAALWWFDKSGERLVDIELILKDGKNAYDFK